MGKTRLTQPVFFRHLSTSDKAVRILTEAEGDDWLHRLTGFNGLWCFCWVQETRKSNHFFIWNLCVSSNTQPLFRMVTSCNTWISQLFATGITGNAVPCAVKRRGYGPQWFPWPLRWRPWGTTWEAAKVSMRTSRGAEADGNSAWNVCRMMGWLGQLGDKFDWRYIYIWCIGDFTSEIYWSSLGLILHLVLDCSARQLRDLQTARPKVEPHVYKDIDMHRPFVLMPCGSTTIQSVVVNMSSFLVCCFQGIPMIFL